MPGSASTIRIGLACCCALTAALAACAPRVQPSVDDLKQALNAQLQQQRPAGFTQRTVLFHEIQPTGSSDAAYRFDVSATVHDYGPGQSGQSGKSGKPGFGQTCVGLMEDRPFSLRRDTSGQWVADGHMTISDAVCQDNPAHGESATPLASLEGRPANTPELPPPQTRAPAPSTPGELTLGEYACYGPNSQLIAGMGFHLDPGGSYLESDGGRSGDYRYDALAASISFSGGFLDGQVGRDAAPSGFALSDTVTCKPWRPG